jgi:peptide/nickel transport system permease protein
VTGYLLRRTLGAVPLLLGIAVLLFVIVELAPGDPVTTRVQPGARSQVVDQLRENWGLDRPLPVRLGTWLLRTAQGDLGTSFSQDRPVAQVVGAALPDTLLLSGTALLGAFVLGIGVGVLQAVRRGSILDLGASVVSLVVHSTPSFWLALMLILVFSLGADHVWDWPVHFPASGTRSVDAEALGGGRQVLDRLWHLALPALTLTLVMGGGIARYTRSAVLEVIDQDYVRAARARGLPPRVVLLRHALRNALIPLVTLLGLYLPVLFSGTVFVEYVFAWPGMGKTLVDAVASRDTPLVMALSLLFAVLVVVGNLVADLLTALVDPRVRVGPGGGAPPGEVRGWSPVAREEASP